MKIISLLILLPEEALVLLIMLVGFLIMFGFKKLAGGVCMVIAFIIFSPMFIEPLLSLIPLEYLRLIGVVISIATFLWLFRLIIGKEAYGTWLGNLLTMATVGIVVWLFRGVFLIPSLLIRLLSLRQ